MDWHVIDLAYLFCWVRLSMRFCNCSRDTGLGGSITPPSNELSDSHGLSIAMNFYGVDDLLKIKNKRQIINSYYYTETFNFSKNIPKPLNLWQKLFRLCSNLTFAILNVRLEMQERRYNNATDERSKNSAKWHAYTHSLTYKTQEIKSGTKKKGIINRLGGSFAFDTQQSV